MPKSSKKASGRKGRQAAQQAGQADFTLAEFADSAGGVALTGRMKKAATRRWDKNVTELCVQSQDGLDSRAWYEKELSDFELDDRDDKDGEGDGGDAETDDVQRGSTRRHARKTPRVEERFSGGVQYPYDLWCLLGDYISPESVGTFAAICRSSHTVVHSARFWTKLYHRYSTEDCGLPEELSARYMEKAHGLKWRVIRALFYCYTPFVARVHSAGAFAEPDVLLGSRCVVMWYRQVKNYWQFFLKFESTPRNTCPLSRERCTSRLSRFEPLVDFNPEQNMSVLQITTTHFTPLPMIMGQRLVKTSVGVSHGMRHHKLKLVFSPVALLRSRGSAHAPGSLSLVLDQVVSVRVLRCWDPKYPHKNSAAAAAD